MNFKEELESLSFRDLQKIAKSRRIRQSGKGITKKRLLSLLVGSLNKPMGENSNILPLQELAVESLDTISNPEGDLFGDRTFSDTDREFNDSNKENANLRRLTFDVVQSRELADKPTYVTSIPPVAVVGAMERQKTGKRVRIHEVPKVANREEGTPKPPFKIVKTPVTIRKSAGKPQVSIQVKMPGIASKTQVAALPKTPRMNKTVALRLASSVKKTEVLRKQSKIPKLDVKKPPNFANIHQNAFDKMDSLWDVEHKRTLRGRMVQSSRSLFQTNKDTLQPPKKITLKVSPKKPLPTKVKSTVTTSIPKRLNTVKIIAPLPAEVSLKEAARQAVRKIKPQKGESMKEERRTFLKGVRINRRFQMQMQNRGLL